MKILYFYYELSGPMYEWQYIHFIEELKMHNIFIETYNPASFENFNQANESLIPYMQKNGPYDLFMSCDESSILYKDTIEKVKCQFSIPTLLICWDNLELPYKQKEIAKVFDLVWITSMETEYLFKSWGCRTIFQTYAANPKLFRPQVSLNQTKSVTFIGTPYGSRANKINLLTKSGVYCQVFSNLLFDEDVVIKEKKIDYYDILLKASRYLRFSIGRKVLYSTIKNQLFSKQSHLIKNDFLNMSRSVTFEKMLQIYSDSFLSLNITELRDTYILKQPILKIHLRTFEIPMSGGLELTSYSDELSSYFEDGKEIIMYKNDEELLDKCQFYLKDENDSLIRNMKINARKRAENEHTWYNRFSNVLSKL